MGAAAKTKPFRFEHLDAVENAFFARALERVKSNTYEDRRPVLKGRTLVPLATDVDENTQVIVTRQYTSVGMAKLIASYADDLPRADVAASESKVSVRNAGNSYGYNVFEVKRAAAARLPLVERKARAARRAFEALVERIFAIGDTATGLLGLLNQPNANTYTLPEGEAEEITWEDKTGDEILADMIGIVEKAPEQTNGAETVDTLLLPRSLYRLARQKRLADGIDRTVLAEFKAMYPEIRVDFWDYLETAGSGGVTRIVAYRNDPEAIEGYIPMDFTQLDPEKRNLEYVIDCIGTIGGVVANLPLSMTYADGA